MANPKDLEQALLDIDTIFSREYPPKEIIATATKMFEAGRKQEAVDFLRDAVRANSKVVRTKEFVDLASGDIGTFVLTNWVNPEGVQLGKA